jgi:toxin HigB-1
LRYSASVIKTFAHKGLARFFETGATTGIQPAHAPRLTSILGYLNHAKNVQDMALPGYRLHPLKGSMKGLWAVKVSGNWRVIFRIEHGDVYVVDYLDYH